LPTFVYCVLDGTLIGMWLVQIPAVEKRVGISHAALGSLLVLLGHGAFFGMQVAGRLADRLGTRLVVPASGVLCGASLVLPGLAREPWALAAALLVFGFGGGCLPGCEHECPRSARGEGLQPPHYVRLARHLLRRSMARGPWDDLCA